MVIPCNTNGCVRSQLGLRKYANDSDFLMEQIVQISVYYLSVLVVKSLQSLDANFIKLDSWYNLIPF